MILFISWSQLKYVNLPIKTVSTDLSATARTSVAFSALTATEGEKTL